MTPTPSHCGVRKVSKLANSHTVRIKQSADTLDTEVAKMWKNTSPYESSPPKGFWVL